MGYVTRTFQHCNAQVKLNVASHNKKIDVFFYAQITAMVGTLNLYLDPLSSHTRGVKHHCWQQETLHQQCPISQSWPESLGRLFLLQGCYEWNV